MSVEELIGLQRRAQQIHASNALLDYVQALTSHTRRSTEYVNGLSPRAALALLHAARAWALMDSREHVLPEDVQAVLSGVVGHRLCLTGEINHVNGADIAEHLMKQVAIP
jgi:MoxR-like ATPase